ncbi:polymer-forming cytoskeletal protein [Sphingosinicella sp. CPCC 101087]|uniref:bactofilin family protein n=1 Tax=Sphingosinicella sp. CPCC 101087 TaxID=2497754 RepID=UPI0013EA38D8|nr:polymer-forming cytoskeletal protein [Sphingosinicella sp. CPCC 101087]
MFSRSKPAKPAMRPAKSGPPGLSFIGSEVVISGDLATTAQVHVDGRVDGSVHCAQLCQGATGIVAGDIVADEARIAGLVEGTVNGKTVVLEASARITGDISYETISIAAGARIDGRLARREALAAGEMLIAAPATNGKGGTDGDGSELFSRQDPPRIAAA